MGDRAVGRLATPALVRACWAEAGLRAGGGGLAVVQSAQAQDRSADSRGERQQRRGTNQDNVSGRICAETDACGRTLRF